MFFSDNRSRGFSKDGKFLSNSFRSLLSLTYSKSKQNIDAYAQAATFALFVLVHDAKILGNNYKLSTPNDLIENEDAIFIGSMLLRLISIFRLNAFNVSKIRFINMNNFEVSLYKFNFHRR